MAEYPNIATLSLTTLVPFPTTYLCEAGVSCSDGNQNKGVNWTYATHFRYYCLLLPPDKSILLQRNKLNVLIDLAFY